MIHVLLLNNFFVLLLLLFFIYGSSTLFGSQASETLTSDDYYSFIDQASMQNEHLQQFIADTVVHTPVVNNVSHKLIKRVAPSVNNTQQPAKKFIVTKSSQGELFCLPLQFYHII